MHCLRNERLHRCNVPAFCGYPLQRFVLILVLVTNRLKIPEVVLRGRRRDHRDNPDVLSAPAINLSHPCFKLGIKLHHEKALRPDQASFFILSEKPDLVALWQAFQGTPNTEGVTTAHGLAIGKGLLRRGRRDFDAVLPPHCSCPCLNAVPQGFRRHSLKKSAHARARTNASYHMLAFSCWLPVPGRDAAPSPQIRSARLRRFAPAAGSPRTHLAAAPRPALWHVPTTSN